MVIMVPLNPSTNDYSMLCAAVTAYKNDYVNLVECAK